MSGASIWLIYFSMTFLEMTAFYIFFRSFFENRINGAVTIFLSYLIVISASLIMDWFGQWKMPVQAIIFVVLCRLFYRASWKQATFFSMLYLSAAWMWDMAVVGMTWRWVPLSYEWPAMIITYVSKSVFILFILCIKKMFAPAWDVGLYRGWEWNRVIFIPLISVIYGAYCYTQIRTVEANATTVMGIISVVLLSIDVVFYKIIQDMVRERQELQIATVKGQKMQSRIDAYNEMEGLLRLQRKKFHDYKNQVQTIAGLIDDGREKEAGSLAKQLAENLSVDSSVVDTKNVTVSRGYITVNGKDIELHDETKTALQNADKEAEQMRRKAFTSYVTEHEAAVAKQQGEAWAKAYEELNDSLLSKLLEPDNADSQEDIPEGVSWSDFDWKTYDVSMDVSLDNMAIGDIHVNKSNVAH